VQQLLAIILWTLAVWTHRDWRQAAAQAAQAAPTRTQLKSATDQLETERQRNATLETYLRELEPLAGTGSSQAPRFRPNSTRLHRSSPTWPAHATGCANCKPSSSSASNNGTNCDRIWRDF